MFTIRKQWSTDSGGQLGQNYVLKGMVQCVSHFTVTIKDGTPWVYVDDMCDSVKIYTSCQDFFHSSPNGWFFAIFEKSKDMHQ